MPSDLLLPERFNNQADNPPNIQGRKTPGSMWKSAGGARRAHNVHMARKTRKALKTQKAQKAQKSTEGAEYVRYAECP